MKSAVIKEINFDVFNAKDLRVVSVDIPIESQVVLRVPCIKELCGNRADDEKIFKMLMDPIRIGEVLISIMDRYYRLKEGRDVDNSQPRETGLYGIEFFYQEDYLNYRTDKGAEEVDTESLLVKLVRRKIESENLVNKIICSINFDRLKQYSRLSDVYFYYPYQNNGVGETIIFVAHVKFEYLKEFKDDRVDVGKIVDLMVQSYDALVSDSTSYYLQTEDGED